jgi:site-specific DNA recombinase
MNAQPRQAAIYCRISEVPKAELDELALANPGLTRRELLTVGSSLGVVRQEKACRQIAAEHGWDVVGVFTDDDRSAYSGKPRPRYLDMLDAIKASEVNAIIAWSPKRLIRHPRELEDFIDLLDAHRVEVATHMAGDYDLSTAGGRLVARVVGAVARHESEEKSERLVLKMTELAERGRFHGGQRPYGYAKDGLTIIPEEAEAIRFMARRVTEGAGLRKIEQELKASNYKTVSGRPWRFTAVSQILTNPRIAGLRARSTNIQGRPRREIVGQAVWPAIIDRATFDQLQAILMDPRRKQARPAKYLLTGLVETPDGHKLTGARAKAADGTFRRRIYKGPGLSIDADQLEEFVVEYVLQKTDEATPPKSRRVPRVSSEVAGLEKELEELAALRGKGTISLREWLAAKKPLDERLAEARAKVPAPRVPAGVMAVLGQKGGLRKAWASEDFGFDLRQRALAQILEKVVVHPVGPSGNQFDSRRIKPKVRHRG